MLFLLAGRGAVAAAVGGVLFQHLHAAVAGDAVAEVDDQIALGQVEKAVDGPRLQPAARRRKPGAGRRIAVE